MRRRSSTALPAMGSRAVRSPTKGNEEIEDFVGFVAFCGNLAPASRSGIALGKTADYTDCADTNQMPNPPPTESAPIRVIRGSRIWSFRERDSMSMRRRSSTALPAMGSRAVRSPTKGNEEIEDFVGFVAFCGNLAPASRPGIALGKTADYTDCADTNQMPNPPPTESAPIRVIRGSRIWSFRERDVGPSFGLWPLLSPLAPVQIGL